ncbi:MAG: hypothetical protein NTW06_02680 [Candidatus Falkowbacteria bacterium]|nr:hypothetical protein [Candidatus Falkowbacteria bacterium]
MDNDFQKTVNLKDKVEQERQRWMQPDRERKKKSKAEGIDEVYQPTVGGHEENLRKISRPIVKKDYGNWYKIILAILAVGLIVGGFYIYQHKAKPPQAENNSTTHWYAVKLQNNEVYYGQIDNTSGDPVVIKNVYYDYDEMNKGEKETNTTDTLRLVKKGKETYGPAGVMELVRSNIIYMDLLKADSKVLKAILDYENKNK